MGAAACPGCLCKLVVPGRSRCHLEWRTFTADLGDQNTTPDALTDLAEGLFAFVAEVSGAAADGYAEARSAAARASEARRRRLLDVLMADPPTETHLVEQAARDADWALPERVAVAVTARETRPRLEGLPLSVPVGERGQQVCLVFPSDRLEATSLTRLAYMLGDSAAGLGPVVPLGQARLSLWRATAALGLAETETGSDRLVRADERALDLLLTVDRGLAGEFSDTALAALDELAADSRDQLTETLAAWLAEPDRADSSWPSPCESASSASRTLSRRRPYPDETPIWGRYRCRRSGSCPGDRPARSEAIRPTAPSGGRRCRPGRSPG